MKCCLSVKYGPQMFFLAGSTSGGLAKTEFSTCLVQVVVEHFLIKLDTVDSASAAATANEDKVEWSLIGIFR